LDVRNRQHYQSPEKNEQVTLVGFGTFVVKERAARMGRNPKPAKPFEIKAARQPGSSLARRKDAVA